MTPDIFAERMRAVLREMATADRELRLMRVYAVIAECLYTNGFGEGVMVLEHFMQQSRVSMMNGHSLSNLTPDLICAENEVREQVRRYRMQADEYRAVADQISNRTARDTYLHLARSYEALAHNLENSAEKLKQRTQSTG